MKKLLSKFSLIKWKQKPCGFCPVQAEGTFMGHHFYFRGRYSKLTIEFSKTRDDWWDDKIVAFYILKETNMYEAGYYPEDKCIRLIYKGCIKFFFNRLISFIWK